MSSGGDGPALRSVATTDGRVPGRRGRATRQRLLDSTVELVTTTPWRSVKVIDIARRAGTSPATFYQYFENVESAIEVLAEEMVEQASELADLVEDGDWSAEHSWDTAQAVSAGFLDYWEANRPVFRVMDLATQEGDAAMRGVLVRALNAVTVTLANAISRGCPSVNGPLGVTTASPAGTEPMAIAGVLVAMFANVSAHRYGFEFWGIRTADLVDSQARFLHWAVTGRPAEGPARAPKRVKGRPARPRTGPVLGGEVVSYRRGRRQAPST